MVSVIVMLYQSTMLQKSSNQTLTTAHINKFTLLTSDILRHVITMTIQNPRSA